VDDLGLLKERLPPGTVSTDPAVLAECAHDWGPLALLRELRGDPSSSPKGVAFPASTEEVVAVLAWAQETRTPIVPRGGGSGVCGGADPGPDALVLDLTRMDRVLSVDAVSQIVRVQAGIRGDRLEEALAGHGLTTGHYPQSIAISTVGGWVAASSAGQASVGHGAIEDILLGLTFVLSSGHVVEVRPVPRSASGPDVRRLLVGSEGTLGVVTEAVLACAALPSSRVWEAFAFERFEQAMAGLREVLRAGVGAEVIRAYDEPDALLTFGSLGHGGGCVALVGFASDLPGLEARMATTHGRAVAAGGTSLGSAYGEHWWVHRNDTTRLYRHVMGADRIFGHGVVVDSMEVAGLWSDLPRLYGDVRRALLEQAEAVGCHLSHLYPSGSSLYFTFLIRGSDEWDAERRYLAAWDAAVRSCLAAGGTMTHHHGVGRLKAPFMEWELGQEGLAVLRSIKRALDPSGLLNPGALLPLDRQASAGP
jgi:alkyldihydroxyacetonephosphate synthase